VISRNLGLYGFKFDKLTASVEDFSDLISYNYVDPLHGASGGNSCGMGYLGRIACVRSYERYSPRSHKDRFIGHLT
jgi:hypothetical protein